MIRADQWEPLRGAIRGAIDDCGIRLPLQREAAFIAATIDALEAGGYELGKPVIPQEENGGEPS